VNATCVMEELATRSGVDVLNKSRNREKNICNKTRINQKVTNLVSGYEDVYKSAKSQRPIPR